MKVDIHPEILKELEYIVKLHKRHGAPAEFGSVDMLVNYVLMAVADGSRRPGSWERQMLQMMGIVADSLDHEVYRDEYGEPK